MTDAAQDPADRSGRQGRLRFVLAAAALAGLLFLPLGGWLAASVRALTSPQRQPQVPNQAEIQPLAQRAQQLLPEASQGARWVWQLETGLVDPHAFLTRLFVSPAYLKHQTDDRRFLQDLSFVINDRPLSDQEVETGELERDRLAMLDQQLQTAGWPARQGANRVTGRITGLALDRTLPPAGAQVMGQVAIGFQASSQGGQTAVRLLSEGRTHSRLVLDPGQENHQINWDADAVEPGQHQLAVWGLGPDGRGLWLELPVWSVPPVTTLADEAVVPARGPGWYRLAARPDQSVRLLVVEADAALEARLWTAWDQNQAKTRAAPEQPGALFYRPQATESAFYVHIEAAPQAAYTLVASPQAAVEKDRPDQVWAVTAQGDEMLTVRRAPGKAHRLALDAVHLIDPEARLGALSLATADGKALAFHPAFSSQENQYALVVPADTDLLAIQAVAMEGSAARLALGRRDADGDRQAFSDTAVVALEPALNTLILAVTGFDQTERFYAVSVLRPQATDRLSAMLDPFPASWQNHLLWTHIHHPAYHFEAQQTGLDWTAFLDAQNTGDKSLIDASSVPDHWVQADSPVYDGSRWKAASRPVVAYYGDPRNFLDPQELFQFEKLTFNPHLHTRQGIEQILAGTFMAPKQAGPDYAGLILAAGQKADISPFFLASRIIQEMGTKGQSPLASGTLEGYEGVFNFYNIGAYPNPEVPNGAQINGARYALFGSNAQAGELTEQDKAWLLPWNSPERAIVGGALWIANRYVAIGQDTLYGQKFDLIEADGLYVHQYAQNIQMAWAEGRRIRANWEALGLLEEPFVFAIPVFENMPQEPAPRP